MPLCEAGAETGPCCRVYRERAVPRLSAARCPSAPGGRAPDRNRACRGSSVSQRESSRFTCITSRRKPPGMSATASRDEKFMELALREAERGLGHTSPNPAVGALIVSPRGRILARGWHRRAGLPHAEIEAIRALRNPRSTRGATLYVTLEPCSTHGRTPPCTEAIIGSGFARVVIGAVDPNPAHAG